MQKLIIHNTSNHRKHVLWAVGLCLGLAFLIGQVLFDRYVYFQGMVRHDNDRLAFMIVDAIRGASKPAVLEPTTKKVYVPDASLVLPAYPSDIPEIRYAYSRPYASYGGGAQITTTLALQSGTARILNQGQTAGVNGSYDPTALFNEVPSAQACSRGILLAFNEKDTSSSADGTLAFTKTLHDGRVVHVYGNDRCKTYSFAPLLDYLKQVESY